MRTRCRGEPGEIDELPIAGLRAVVSGDRAHVRALVFTFTAGLRVMERTPFAVFGDDDQRSDAFRLGIAHGFSFAPASSSRFNASGLLRSARRDARYAVSRKPFRICWRSSAFRASSESCDTSTVEISSR